MPNMNYYDICCKYMGRKVRIHDCYGNVHYGRITNVDRRQVWLMPERNMLGLGIGFWGYPGYGNSGFGYGIALGTILGVALVGAFII